MIVLNSYDKRKEKIRTRERVLQGLQEVKEGKTKDFYTVCDRLEKKYSSEILQDTDN